LLPGVIYFLRISNSDDSFIQRATYSIYETLYVNVLYFAASVPSFPLLLPHPQLLIYINFLNKCLSYERHNPTMICWPSALHRTVALPCKDVPLSIYETFLMKNLLFGPIYFPIHWIPVPLFCGVKLLLRLEMIGAVPALTHTTYDVHINKYVSVLPFNGVHVSFIILINSWCRYS
jgi:hypothetical protein